MKPKQNYSADKYVPSGMDLCQTPAYALDPLLPFLKRGSIIWEPAAGEGYLAAALCDAGLHVVTSDIQTRQNFFDYVPHVWGSLVTNPPYGLKAEWLERCYDLDKPFALLVPVEMIGTGRVYKLMEKHGAELLLLDKRVNFKMPNQGWKGTAQFPVLWLCWQLLPTPIVYGHIVRRPFAAPLLTETTMAIPRQLALIP